MDRRRTGPAVTVASVNRGGGKGKTTTTSHLAAYFAMRSFATLLVSIEDHCRAYLRLVGSLKRNAPPLPVAKTSYALLHPAEYNITAAPYQINLNDTFQRSGLAKEAIERVKAERGWQNPNRLDLIPGSPMLRGIDEEFALKEQNAQLEAESFDPNAQLTDSLDALRELYDVIVIDTPAALSKMTWNALRASDYAFIPMAFDPDSIEDYDETHRTFMQVVSACERLERPAPQLIGYTGNFFVPTFSLDRAIFQSYVGPHPDPDTGLMVPAAIPYPMLGCLPLDKETVSNALAKHMTVHTSAPQSEFGKAMFDFCENTAKAVGL